MLYRFSIGRSGLNPLVPLVRGTPPPISLYLCRVTRSMTRASTFAHMLIGANDRLRDFSVKPIHERIAGGVGVLGASDQVLGDLAQIRHVLTRCFQFQDQRGPKQLFL